DRCVGDIPESGRAESAFQKEPDHARAVPVFESEPPHCFDHSTNQNARRCHGCSQVSNGYGAFHWSIASVLYVHDSTGTRSRPGEAWWGLSDAPAGSPAYQIIEKVADGRT